MAVVADVATEIVALPAAPIFPGAVHPVPVPDVGSLAPVVNPVEVGQEADVLIALLDVP